MELYCGRVLLVKDGADINKLPLDGTYDEEIQFSDEICEKLDDLFIKNGIYDSINALFGPGDSEYVEAARCNVLVKTLLSLTIDNADVKKATELIVGIGKKAVERNTGLYFDL